MTGDDVITALEKENTELINRIFDLEAEKEALIAGQETLQKALAEKNAEIERLKPKCEDCAGCSEWKCDCANIKSEAYKEFAERLKEKTKYAKQIPAGEYFVAVDEEDIDNLVKELTEGSNDKG